MKKILRNRARCRGCSQVVESKFRRYYSPCLCWFPSHGEKGIVVFGGLDMLGRQHGHRSAKRAYMELSEYIGGDKNASSE